MPQIYLCFLWHMHQPFYKDLTTGEYKLPWTRMHALKDYYGMVRILEEFPKIRQTFNLVPSMMVQVEEYAAGQAADPFLEMALRPAESLTEDDRSFLLRTSFYSDPQRMIHRYPRYSELFTSWQAHKDGRSRSLLGAQELRDLQMWSQLAWFDEEFKDNDPEIRAWIERGRNFTVADQARMGARQREFVGKVPTGGGPNCAAMYWSASETSSASVPRRAAGLGGGCGGVGAVGRARAGAAAAGAGPVRRGAGRDGVGGVRP